MDRLIVVARLCAGAEEHVQRLIEQGPPFALERFQIQRHTVHVGDGVAVFVFEGTDVEWVIEEIVNDPVLAASFGGWAPFLEGRPSIAHERFAWEREPA